jgi:hypothetical protein
MMMVLVLLLVECFGKLRLVLIKLLSLLRRSEMADPARQELSVDIDIVAAGTVAVV